MIRFKKRVGKEWRKYFAILPKKFVTSTEEIWIWLTFYERCYRYEGNCQFLDHYTVKIDNIIYRLVESI